MALSLESPAKLRLWVRGLAGLAPQRAFDCPEKAAAPCVDVRDINLWVSVECGSW